MLPFARCITLWRLERELTQDALARKAGIPRPNVSALERGAVEPTLKTIRRLAGALGIRPGLLVDGRAPGQEQARPLTRAAMERIARSLVTRRPLTDPFEREIAQLMDKQVAHRLPSLRSFRHRGSVRQTRLSWLLLESLLEPQELKSLLNRVEKSAQVM